MPVTLQQLQTFRSVARQLSFSAAARELFTTQPHVSNQIRSLEEHYRLPLFVRTRGQISLTEAGTALYAKVTTILAEVGESEQIVREFRRLDRGSVRVAATSSFGNHLLPGLIADFHTARPEITVIAQVGNTERVWEMAENDEAELAVTTAQPPTTRKLNAEPFVRDDLVLLCPSRMDVSDRVSADDLAGMRLVLREEGSLTLTVLRQLLEGRDLRVAAQLSGTAAVNEAVAAGVGVSLVPESSVGAWLAAGSVTIRRLQGVELKHDYVLAYSPSRFQTSAASALLDHLRGWAQRRATRRLG